MAVVEQNKSAPKLNKKVTVDVSKQNEVATKAIVHNERVYSIDPVVPVFKDDLVVKGECTEISSKIIKSRPQSKDKPTLIFSL